MRMARVRVIVPPWQVEVQLPNDPHSPYLQLPSKQTVPESHASLFVRVVESQATPPFCASEASVRLCVRVPLPQVTLHAPQLPHIEYMQSTGQPLVLQL